MRGLDLVDAHAVDQTEILLTKNRIGDHGEHQLAARGLGGLTGPQQVAGIDPADGFAGQPLCNASGLLQAGGVQAHVAVALEPQLAIPFGFAMANQDQICHAPIIPAAR